MRAPAFRWFSVIGRAKRRLVIGHLRLKIGVELVLWLVALVWWNRGRSRVRADKVAKRRRERLERAPRPADFALEGELAGYDDLDGFWEEQ